MSLLTDIQARLSNLEKASGVTPPASAAPAAGGGGDDAPASPAVKAYNDFIAEHVDPLVATR